MNSNTLTTDDNRTILVDDRHGEDLGLTTQPIHEPVPNVGVKGLEHALNEYETCVQQTKVCEQRVQSAIESEQAALSATELNDEEVSDKIWIAQKERNVYEARVASGRINSAKLLKQLEQAIGSVQSEYSNKIREIFGLRREIVCDRVIKALQPGDTLHPTDLDDFVEHSKHLQEVRALDIPAFVRVEGNPSVTTEHARRLLDVISRTERLGEI
jgi:hypothetical protein